jgi:hypothetical protein
VLDSSLTISTKLDWLQGVCYFNTLARCFDFYDWLVAFKSSGDRWYSLERSLWRGELYQTSYGSTAHFLSGISSLDDRFKVYLEISGQFLSSLELHQQFTLFSALFQYGFRFTRCDIALDDYLRRSPFYEVLAFGRAGDFRPFESFKYIETSVQGGVKSPTCYFGSPLGRKLLRMYDAEIVHGIPADRWELQLRDDYCRNALELWDSGLTLQSIVLGSIYFDSPWWASLCSEVSCLSTVSGPQRDNSLEKIVNWLFSQVAPSLALLVDCYGYDSFLSLLDQLVSVGRDRFRPWHFAMIRKYKSEVSL